MVLTVFVTSRVPEPAIETCAGHLETWSDVFVICYKSISTVDQSMLEEYHRFSYIRQTILCACDAE